MSIYIYTAKVTRSHFIDGHPLRANLRKVMLLGCYTLILNNMSEDYSLRDTVFREFLKNPSLGPAEMATKISAKYNSVKAAYAKLAEDGLLQRTGRGNYEPNYGWITIYILDRLEKIEKGVK